MKTKICTKCGKEKSISEFWLTKKGTNQYRSNCKECSRITRRKYEKRSKRWRKYSANNKDHLRKYHNARNRGMTIEEREQFLADRDFRCEICGLSREQSYELYHMDLCIDHDHSTNVNKGVLCVVCNSASGKLRDNTELAYKLYQYLRRTRTKKN